MAKCGQKTEIYSRVVGYFRPILNWNRGKKEEYNERKPYKVKPSDNWFSGTGIQPSNK